MQTTATSHGPIRKIASVALITCAFAVSTLAGFQGHASAQDPTLQMVGRHRGIALTFVAQPARSSRGSYLHWRTGFVAP